MCFYILPDALLGELFKLRGSKEKTKHKKYRGHYDVSTKDFPINFSSIFNWFYKWYERGLKSYYGFEESKIIIINKTDS